MKSRILALALLAACGGPAGPMKVVPPPSDLDVLMQRVDTGALIFGGTRKDLDGWTVYLQSGTFDCGNRPGEAAGCADGDNLTIRIDTLDGMPHCRYLPMMHEAGHAVMLAKTGNIDPDHKDPRWRTMDNAARVCINLD